MTTKIIRYLDIILVSLLAGLSFGIWIGFNPSSLSAIAYIEQQQKMLESLRTFLVVVVLVATFITIISAYLQRKYGPTFVSLLIAAGFLIAYILVTRFGNKPIDDAVLRLTKDSIPANWAELRDKWWSFHIVRTISEIAAFLIIIWTSIKKEDRTVSNNSPFAADHAI